MVDSQSLVTHLRAAHSARVISRSKPWKCGASRTLFPFVTVFAHNKTQAINFYSTGNHKSTLYFLNVIKKYHDFYGNFQIFIYIVKCNACS